MIENAIQTKAIVPDSDRKVLAESVGAERQQFPSGLEVPPHLSSSALRELTRTASQEVPSPTNDSRPAQFGGTLDNFETVGEFVEARRAHDLAHRAVSVTEAAGSIAQAVTERGMELVDQREKNQIFRSPKSGDYMKVGHPDLAIDTALAFERIAQAFGVTVPEVRGVFVDPDAKRSQSGAIVMSGVENRHDGLRLKLLSEDLYELVKDQYIRPIQQFLKSNGFFEELSDQNWGLNGPEVLERFKRGITPSPRDIVVWDPVY